MALSDINLVPWDVLEKNIQFRHIRFWATCLMGVILVLGISYGRLYFWSALMQKTAWPSQGVGVGRDKVAAKVAALSVLQDQIQALQERNHSLTVLARGQMVFDILARFSLCLNDQTWITALSIKQTPEISDQAVLECEGMSRHHSALGAFINRLSQLQGIQEVVLGNANNTYRAATSIPEAPEASSGLVQFNLSAILVRSSAHDPSN